MERILKILIISIISFLLLLWIITGVNSCKDKKEEQLAEINVDTTMTADTLDLTDDIFSDDPSLNSEVAGNTPSGTGTEGNSDLNDYVGTSQTIAENEPKVINEDKTSEPNQSYESKPASSSKPYFIISGNYIDKKNAEVMKKKLLKLNFNNAEIVNFDLSQYFTVIAGRYSTESQARDLASKLKNKGIDCYVKKRQN